MLSFMLFVIFVGGLIFVCFCFLPLCLFVCLFVWFFLFAFFFFFFFFFSVTHKNQSQNKPKKTNWKSVPVTIAESRFWNQCKVPPHAGRHSMHLHATHADRHMNTYKRINSPKRTDSFAFLLHCAVRNFLCQHVADFLQWCVSKYTSPISPSRKSCLIQ